MIAIIDYGMGNLRSVQKGFERVGHDAVVTRDPRRIADASHVVLPGVGAFKDCMENLKNYNLLEPICKAIESGKPFLGICLGLQILFTESEEFGRHRGLDLIKGKVVRFNFKLGNQDSQLKVPHIGWNDIRIKCRTPVLEGIDDGFFFYFVHSYYVIPEDERMIATTTSYGMNFTSSICMENIFACQFHPEKSQEGGLKILKNFGDLS
ncbi:MAG: imidazole glycerol phosphate synthase subunit HisH [Nitrospinae bacterium]|nr:imidazole glycerol phosphate synthase subunit HisH [Nitrospinota bacterium]